MNFTLFSYCYTQNSQVIRRNSNSNYKLPSNANSMNNKSINPLTSQTHSTCSWVKPKLTFVSAPPIGEQRPVVSCRLVIGRSGGKLDILLLLSIVWFRLQMSFILLVNPYGAIRFLRLINLQFTTWSHAIPGVDSGDYNLLCVRVRYGTNFKPYLTLVDFHSSDVLHVFFCP